ncbi:hypothetical protein EI94DRAFT_1698917 [Lactarius quietus]|nr:hypothetical protein EI94DRAFT_1698917 [Lactarius quietus]
MSIGAGSPSVQPSTMEDGQDHYVLCDDDIEETRLNSLLGSQSTVMVNQRDHKNTSRSNELVRFKAKSKDVHQDKPQATRKLSKSKATKVTVKNNLDKRQEYADINLFAGTHTDIFQ